MHSLIQRSGIQRAKRVLGERVVCLCGCLCPAASSSGEEIGEPCRSELGEKEGARNGRVFSTPGD